MTRKEKREAKKNEKLQAKEVENQQVMEQLGECNTEVEAAVVLLGKGLFTSLVWAAITFLVCGAIFFFINAVISVVVLFLSVLGWFGINL